MQIEAEVHFCRHLASAVLSPVHAVSHQLNDRGVHRMDLDLEASQQTLALRPAEKLGLAFWRCLNTDQNSF